jgi:SAM-dependent methyltransferase
MGVGMTSNEPVTNWSDCLLDDGELIDGVVVVAHRTSVANFESMASYERQFETAVETGESIYGEFSPLLEAAHERRIALLDALPIGDLTDAVVVDYGVGSWGFACIYPRLHQCARAIGMDIAEAAIRESARVSAAGSFGYGNRVAYVQSDGHQLRIVDGSVDVFFTGECIEHVVDTEAFLDEIHRVLSPGGHLVLTTPNRDAYLYRVNGIDNAAGPEHTALMNLSELLGYLQLRFDVEVIKGFNHSLLPALDPTIADAEFAIGWAAAFEDSPALATGIVLMARRRDGYVSPGVRRHDNRYHHDVRVHTNGAWDVAFLHGEISGRRSASGTLATSVEGTDIFVLFWAFAWGGLAELIVDGIGQIVDTYNEQGGFRRVHLKGCANGPHDVSIKVTGRKNHASKGHEVIVYQILGSSPVSARANS